MLHIITAAAVGFLLHKHQDQFKKAFGSPAEVLALIKKVYNEDMVEQITKLVAAGKLGKDEFMKALEQLMTMVKEKEEALREKAGIDPKDEEKSTHTDNNKEDETPLPPQLVKQITKLVIAGKKGKDEFLKAFDQYKTMVKGKDDPDPKNEENPADPDNSSTDADPVTPPPEKKNPAKKNK